MLKLKLQYSGHLMRRANSLERTLMLGKIEDRRRRGQHMVEWHHWFNGHEFEQNPRQSEGRRSLACCSPWGCRVGHKWATEQQLAWQTQHFFYIAAWVIDVLSVILKWNPTACSLFLLYSTIPLFSSPCLPSLRARFCKAAASQGCPGGLGVNPSPSNAGIAGSIPGWEPKVLNDSRPKKQSIKQMHHGNKFNKGFKKMVHINKIK